MALVHALARRAGLRPAFAAFAGLTLGLSPLFLPLAASYMTDVPALCFTLAALYAAVRAADDDSVAWLAACVVIGVVGGTGRQVVWAVPLAVVPYVGWARRADRRMAVAAALGWAATAAAVAWTMAWFARQPYALAGAADHGPTCGRPPTRRRRSPGGSLAIGADAGRAGPAGRRRAGPRVAAAARPWPPPGCRPRAVAALLPPAGRRPGRPVDAQHAHDPRRARHRPDGRRPAR